MTDKKKYHKLDDIGIIGQQTKLSAASRAYHIRKTGEIFRRQREKFSISKTFLKRPLM
jgi:hypothetical protein